MPVPARRLESGTIWVDVTPGDETGRVVLYARVSSHDQRSDLDRQVARCLCCKTEFVFAVDSGGLCDTCDDGDCPDCGSGEDDFCG